MKLDEKDFFEPQEQPEWTPLADQPPVKLAIPAYLSDDLPRAVFCSSELAPASVERTPETFATLNEKPAEEPLRGVSMAYSLIRQNGERESGKVLLLGDVAHDRGMLRLQTDRGDYIDAPQKTWEKLVHTTNAARSSAIS